MSTLTDPDTESRDNLTRLLKLGRRKRMRVDRRYSFVVRSLKLVLPLVALGIIVIVFSWPRMDEAIAPIPRENIISQQAGRNELIDPHFESADRKNRPYLVTATRALQSLEDQALVILEQPKAEMALGDEDKISGQADSGGYRQHDETLLMQGNVRIFHTGGYELSSDLMNVALKTGLAWTESAVTVRGADGLLSSSGMNADARKGIVIFKGPAKLTMNKGIQGLSQ